MQEYEGAVGGGEGSLGAWPRGNESLCTWLEHTLLQRPRPGYLRSRQRPRVGRVGAGEHSILPGPQAPFVPPVWPALRCPLALAPETFSEAPEGRDWI